MNWIGCIAVAFVLGYLAILGMACYVICVEFKRAYGG